MRQLNIRIRQVESETSKVLNTFSFLFLKNNELYYFTAKS